MTSNQIAIVAGSGSLPRLLAESLTAAGAPALVFGIDGFPVEGITPDATFRVERLALFIDDLADRGVTRVVFAGAIRRPRLDPALFDPRTAMLVPRLLPLLQKGDDALLRGVIELFEESDLAVAGVGEVAPDLVPGPGVLGAHRPSVADETDAARAAELVAMLGAEDLGQGAVVAQGLCLALESLPGTDAMLEFVARTGEGLRPDPAGAKGVLFKAPKPGQDRRMDLPALGPATVRAAARAGLAGIAFEAGGVVLLDRAEMLAEAEAAGLFLWARQP